MVTSFFQVGLECLSRLNSGDHSIIELTLPAIIIMSSTVVIKGLCWFWCRLVKNSSVQALAADAMTDVVFNIFSIIFPLGELTPNLPFGIILTRKLVGFYAKLWWLDALGGLLLSLFVIFNWAGVSTEHIRNLTGAAATADQRNVLLYLTMRFAKTIKQIQGLQAYHAGDKLNVEVDIVLDENMNLRDSHDLGESLQYILESVPTVDRAFVHIDVSFLTYLLQILSANVLHSMLVTICLHICNSSQIRWHHRVWLVCSDLWLRSFRRGIGLLIASVYQRCSCMSCVQIRNTNHCVPCITSDEDSLILKLDHLEIARRASMTRKNSTLTRIEKHGHRRLKM
jgi:divalent metal cation (Fe/Co/Zn/Cd) transporter